MSTYKTISFIKSGVRLVACAIGGLAFFNYLAIAFWLLFVAEIIGIIEELGEK
jgi:hypothetical protein